mgnify:CR=1 FL=1
MLIKIIIGVIAFLVGAILMFPLGMNYRKRMAEKEIGSAEDEAKRIINESIKSAESKKREALLEAALALVRERLGRTRALTVLVKGSHAMHMGEIAGALARALTDA